MKKKNTWNSSKLKWCDFKWISIIYKWKYFTRDYYYSNHLKILRV